jgi:glutaredoxin 3
MTAHRAADGRLGDNPMTLPGMQREWRGMNPVRMFTTQTCPYCVRAKALLRQRGVDVIDEIRVDLQTDQREQMVRLTGRRTVPQIFIGETHVGGCDDLFALDQRGGLLPLLGQPAA